MKNKLLIVILSIFFMYSCKNKDEKFVAIIFQKEKNFGKIKVNDTIIKKFEIINISSIPLKIKQIKTRCGCTVAKIKDSIVPKNSSTVIKVQFIAKKNNLGFINKSIVIDANTKPNFTVLYLKGEVIE